MGLSFLPRLSSLRLLRGLALAAALGACGAGDDNVVLDTSETIADGHYVSYALDAGTYQAEITASNNGVNIEWVGGSCSAVSSVKTYVQTCTMSSKGQLTITNPTLLGLGGAEIVTIKLTEK